MIQEVEIKERKAESETTCFHCGKPNPQVPRQVDGHAFCCSGCASVYEILQAGALCQYYNIENNDRKAPDAGPEASLKFDFLANEEIVREIADFYTEKMAAVTLLVPGMHCAACLWLLEHLNRLEPAVVKSRVDFVRKELSIEWTPGKASLQDIVLLLCRIGYEPIVEKGGNATQTAHRSYMRGLVMRLGVVGFCAGNIMLFSFPEYLGIIQTQELGVVFNVFKVLLTLPVVIFGASEYLKGAWVSLRQRQFSLDIPLSLGILTLFIRSLADTFIASGPGFYDSLAGLVLFLLAGRWVQARSFDHLRFDQTMDDYFPLAATVVEEDGTKSYKKADTLVAGQTVEIQSEMLFPADGILLGGPALIDYSFATGEGHPALVQTGNQVFAGGRLKGQSVRVKVERPLSRSRFINLWNHHVFKPTARKGFAWLIESRFAFWFNVTVLTLALGSGFYWAFTSAEMAWQSATAVLIVACPCALSLAMPFATQAGMQKLARHGVFLRRSETLEELAGIDALVFDKTGTLTQTLDLAASWEGDPLTNLHQAVLFWMASQSRHPLARAIAMAVPNSVEGLQPHAFEEIAGQGLQAVWIMDTYRLGSLKFVTAGRENNLDHQSTRVSFACNGHVLGTYSFSHQVRPGVDKMFESLSEMKKRLAIVSGDSAGEGDQFRTWVDASDLVMEASPLQKLEFLENLRERGIRAAMIGDGMNDAGAFAAAGVGIAVRENQSHFTPACDVILDAGMVRNLPFILQFAHESMRGVLIAFGVSLMFNAISLAFAVTGQLSPPVAALLMPLGSITVVLTSIALVRKASVRFEKALIQS